MATSKIAGLFDMTSPRQIEQDYLNQFLVSPAQMGQQNLLNQVVSIMSNAGTNIGASGARMLGGRLPEVIKQEDISNIFKDIQSLNLPKNSQTYTELAKRLQASGYSAEASLALEKASEYAQKEQEAVLTAGKIEQTDLANQLSKATLAYNITKAGADATYAERTLQDRINKASTEAERAALQKQLDEITLENTVNEQAARQELAMATPGTPEYKIALDKVLQFTSPQSLIKEPEKFGVDREAVSKEMFRKGYGELTSPQAAAVNARLLMNQVKVSRATAVSLGKDIAAFDTLTKDNRETLNAAEDAQSLLIEAATSNNPDAWESARTTVARAVGKSKLSNEDIKRLGGTPQVWNAIKNLVSKAFTGVPSAEQQASLYAVATIIARAEQERINNYSDRFRAAATEQGYGGMADIYYPKVTRKYEGQQQTKKAVPWAQWKSQQGDTQ